MDVPEIDVCQMMKSEAAFVEDVRESLTLISFILEKGFKRQRKCPIDIDCFMARGVQCA